MGVMLVTGASRGIGSAIAAVAAQAGWDVALNFNRAADKAEAVAKRVKSYGRRATVVQADVGVEGDVVRMFSQIDRDLGPVNAVVNNAAIDQGSTLYEAKTEDLQRLLMVNVMGPWLCAREAALRMSTKRGGAGGVIVNVSSVSAKTGGLPKDVMYAGSKGALDSITLGLAREVGREGIRIVGVRPGITRTEIFDNSEGGLKAAEAIANRDTAIGRMAEPAEVAELVVWLCSDQARYVTCTVYDVSAGR